MKRKRYVAKYKARVAIEAIKGKITIAEISSKYGLHSNWISKWRKKAL